MRKITASAAVLLLAAGMANAAPRVRDDRPTVSPDSPGKEIPQSVGGPVENLITISCAATHQAVALGTCSAQGPFTVPTASINNPDQFGYFKGCCTPGSLITLQANRTTSAMDPAMHSCSGDFCGQSNAGWGAFSCPAGTFLGSADDNNGRPCNAGGFFADPRYSFVCPASGKFTTAVYDFIGAGGGPPTFVLNCTNCIACAAPSSCDLAPIEAKLDARLDVPVSSRSSSASVAAIEGKLDARLDATVSSRASQVSVDALEAKLDALQTQISNMNCVLIDLLLTPEKRRCHDSAECGFGAFPSGLENFPDSPACAALNNLHGGTSDASGTATAGFAAALKSDAIDPAFVLPASKGGMLEGFAKHVTDSVKAYRELLPRDASVLDAEQAVAEAEKLRQEGQYLASYRLYRDAYRKLAPLGSQLK